MVILTPRLQVIAKGIVAGAQGDDVKPLALIQNVLGGVLDYTTLKRPRAMLVEAILQPLIVVALGP